MDHMSLSAEISSPLPLMTLKALRNASALHIKAYQEIAKLAIEFSSMTEKLL